MDVIHCQPTELFKPANRSLLQEPGTLHLLATRALADPVGPLCSKWSFCVVLQSVWHSSSMGWVCVIKKVHDREVMRQIHLYLHKRRASNKYSNTLQSDLEYDLFPWLKFPFVFIHKLQKSRKFFLEIWINLGYHLCPFQLFSIMCACLYACLEVDDFEHSWQKLPLQQFI